MKFLALALIALGFLVSTIVYVLSNGYLGKDERGRLSRTISTVISAVAGLMFIIVTWNSFIDAGAGLLGIAEENTNPASLSSSADWKTTVSDRSAYYQPPSYGDAYVALSFGCVLGMDTILLDIGDRRSSLSKRLGAQWAAEFSDRPFGKLLVKFSVGGSKGGESDDLMLRMDGAEPVDGMVWVLNAISGRDPLVHTLVDLLTKSEGELRVHVGDAQIPVVWQLAGSTQIFQKKSAYDVCLDFEA